MSAKKITCLGGGSFYYARLLPELLVSKDMAGSEIVLYDIAHDKAEKMAAMGRRLSEKAGMSFRVRASADLGDALDGADFAISSIGGSGAGVAHKMAHTSYYHTTDVQIAGKYGIEQLYGGSGGPAAMMEAFRVIPVYLHLCREMEKRCPKVILFNRSNPMAVLCRMMRKYSGITVIGMCHGVQTGRKYLAEVLGVPAEELDCLWIGTNHYYWLTRVAHFGKDLYPELKRRMSTMEIEDHRQLSLKLSKIYGYWMLFPWDDHIIEFYPFLAQAEGGADGLPYAFPEAAKRLRQRGEERTPSEVTSSDDDHKEYLAHFDKMVAEATLPGDPAGPRTHEKMTSILDAITAGRREVCIANIANQGCIPNLPATAEVEIEAVTDSCGVRGVHMGDAPLHLKGLLEKRFVWHEFVADAAVKGDRNLALQAMMLDETTVWPDKAEAMLDEMLNASQDLLPQFFPA